MKSSSDLNQIYWICGRAAESIFKFLYLKENHPHSFGLGNCAMPMRRGRLKFRVSPPQQSANRLLSALYSRIIYPLHQGWCVSTNSQMVTKFKYFSEKKPKVSLLEYKYLTSSRIRYHHFHFLSNFALVHPDINLRVSQPPSLCIIRLSKAVTTEDSCCNLTLQLTRETQRCSQISHPSALCCSHFD